MKNEKLKLTPSLTPILNFRLKVEGGRWKKKHDHEPRIKNHEQRTINNYELQLITTNNEE